MNWKIILIILIVLIGLAGIGVGVYLVQQQQDIRDEAAVPGGISEVFVTPSTKTAQAGDTFPVDISFSTGGETISAIAIQLQYSYTGAQPPVEVTDIAVNSDLTSTSEWSFPVKKIEDLGGQIQIRIAAINLSTTGYSSSTDTKVATLNLKANAPGTITMEFDPQESKITQKTTAEDILLIPVSTGVYTVNGEVGGPADTPTPTVTGTSSGASPTATPQAGSSTSPTPTPSPASQSSTATPTRVSESGATNTPTPVQELIEAGSTETTMVLAIAGLIFIVIGGLLFI